MSPSLNHEKIAEIINGLVKAYCRTYNLLYFSMGSTTLKNPFTVGKRAAESRADERRKGTSAKTPDHSFSFEFAKDIPDLAIEVIFSSGSISDLQKYTYLGVKEVWIWQNEEIKFYQLINNKYIEIAISSCLEGLAADFIIGFINRGLTESPLIIERDFCDRLAS